MSSSNHTILKLKDKSDNNIIEKTNIDNVAFKMLISGKSGLGKTNLLANFLLLPNFYLNDFHADDIYIFSGSLKGDLKMETIIREKEIPESNCFDDYDNDILKDLYNVFMDEFNERTKQKKKIYNKLIILDDLSFSGVLKSKHTSQINRTYCNGRKFNISIIVTSQKYTQIDTVQRANFTSAILYNCSNAQLEVIEQDCNYMKNKKSFKNMFRSEAPDSRDFICVNFSNPIDNMYLNKNFEPIDKSKYEV